LSFADITPAALFSSVAAIESIERGTSTDVLQTLFKLPEYKSLVPKFREAISVLSKLARRDLSLSTLKDICDLAASTILQSSFQWRPLLQLLLTELPKMVVSLSQIRNESELVVGRGRWVFDFPPGSLGRSAAKLTARSKIVLDVSGRKLATVLFGIDGLGVLPKPSYLWDLVPFSFVLNWFTSIGANMERSEYAALLATLPAYYVHTYTISSPFTDEELAIWSLRSSSSDPISLRLFYRDVSHRSPVPRDSRFGMGLPTSLPPIGTIGALLYQIFF
jgi:hypothetical protein